MNKLKKNSLFHKISLIIISLFLGVSLITFNYFIVGKSASISGFNVPYLTAETNDAEKWIANGNSITGTAKGKDKVGCSSETPDKTTLSIGYTNDFAGTIEFDYSIESKNGDILIDGTTINDDGHFSKNNISNQGKKIEVVINSKNGTETIILLKNIICKIAKNITLTFKPSENGQYSLNGQIIENIYHFSTTGDKEFKLLATPDEGYSFNGRMLNGTIVSSENPRTTTYPDDAEITAIFIDSRLPTFLNAGKYFTDLHNAIESASNNTDKKIILSRSGTILSSNNNTYIFQNGMQFLIPCENTYKMNTSEETDKLPLSNNIGIGIPKSEYILSLEDNVELIFESGTTCYVASEAWCGTGGQNGAGSPSKECGHIKLLGNNSNVIMKADSKLFAYGYITGSGLVKLESNSFINEFFQIGDFKGGSKTTGCLKKVFPFNQYYIQNIESRVQFVGNVTEKVCTGFKVSVLPDVKTIFPFISSINNSNETALFKLSNDAVLERKYESNNDRIYYTLNSGNANISSISLSVAGTGIESKDYQLPIPSNMSLRIKSGVTVNINQDLIFLPGSELIIEENATVYVNSGINIYLYDRNSWIGKKYSNNVDMVPIFYSPTKKYNRTNNDLINSKLDLNGTLNISNSGGIYITNGNNNYANIFSSNGTGKIIFNGELNEQKTIQQYNFVSGVEQNTLYPLYLRNSTNELESTTDTYCNLLEEKPLIGNTIHFDKVQNKWMKKSSSTSSYKITFVDSNNSSLKVEKEYDSGEVFLFPSSNETQFNNFTYNGYKVKKWIIEGDGIFDAGKSYQLSSSRDLTAYAIYGGWASLNGDKYYIDYNSGAYYKGLMKVEDDGEIKICKFKDDTGIFDYGYTNIYLNPTDNKYYFIINGVVQEKGFYKYSLDNTSTDYNYVFVNNDNTLLTNGTYYIDVSDINNSLLPSGYYTFDNNGLISKEDKTISNYNGDNVYIANINNEGDSTYINGIRVGYGLFIDNNHYKYSNTEGYIVKNTTYYVSNINNLNNIKEGLYYFDNNGFMYDENFNIIEVN